MRSSIRIFSAFTSEWLCISGAKQRKDQNKLYILKNVYATELLVLTKVLRLSNNYTSVNNFRKASVKIVKAHGYLQSPFDHERPIELEAGVL